MDRGLGQVVPLGRQRDGYIGEGEQKVELSWQMGKDKVEPG